MAVSDYRLRRVSNAALAARALAELARGADFAHLEIEELASLFAGALEHPPALPSQQTKISSGEQNLILFLEPVQKIISLFRELAPDAILTGFKLLDHAPREELIDAGFDLLEKNRCAFVFANDMAEIDAQSHSGYLIDTNKNVRRFEGKKEIAGGIVESVLREFAKRSAG
jgi:phosphopantothenate-cysteine ligase